MYSAGTEPGMRLDYLMPRSNLNDDFYLAFKIDLHFDNRKKCLNISQ
jgi:hypothetical protein